ncbi:magnesium transporter CorA family protein [Patescibacteria group bacterium]|nr:magnesium transporter CorA family protein [Patescibacteria group bacterium]MBU3922873.1 magnesium transporter CorA family protein [Patescibacteria group bacterium]
MNEIKINELTWIDVIDPDKKDIEHLSKKYAFDKITLKELLSPTLRPKVEHFDDYLFMVLRFPIYDPKEKSTNSIELDFLITKNTLITIRYESIKPLEEFWKTCQTQGQKLNSPALLMHCILEELTNFSLRQIDHITKKINHLEKGMFKVRRAKQEDELVKKISLIRMDILNFRRTIQPQESILESLKIRGVEFFGKKLKPYFTDIIGDHMRIWNLLENHKETIESLQETNDSLLTNKANRIMTVLTMFAVVVFPLTLLAAIFGMNTKYLPFVGTSNDFWIILSIMMIGTMFMLIMFRGKKWL